MSESSYLLTVRSCLKEPRSHLSAWKFLHVNTHNGPPVFSIKIHRGAAIWSTIKFPIIKVKFIPLFREERDTRNRHPLRYFLQIRFSRRMGQLRNGKALHSRIFQHGDCIFLTWHCAKHTRIARKLLSFLLRLKFVPNLRIQLISYFYCVLTFYERLD